MLDLEMPSMFQFSSLQLNQEVQRRCSKLFHRTNSKFGLGKKTELSLSDDAFSSLKLMLCF